MLERSGLREQLNEFQEFQGCWSAPLIDELRNTSLSDVRSRAGTLRARKHSRRQLITLRYLFSTRNFQRSLSETISLTCQLSNRQLAHHGC